MKPAILGGKAAFKDTIPINRPTVPGIEELTEELSEILSSGMLTNSKYVAKFEETIADYLNVKNVVCVSNCTSGLMLVVKCLGLSGSVIVPSFTFPATVHSLVWNGIKPILIDCDPETLNIDPTAIEELIQKDTSAIMAVHIFGNPCDVVSLEEIAKRKGLALIFDSAHALGSKYNGRFAGNFGNAEVFSLAPTKLITSGEGGIIATNDNVLADKLRLARNYGNPGNYNCELLGLNARMSEIHALLGLKSLKLLEDNIHRRNELTGLYLERLKALPGLSFQRVADSNRSTYNYFSIIVDEKEFGINADMLMDALLAENIMTRRYFFPPIHKQKVYDGSFDSGSLEATDYVGNNILCLPLFSHMKNEDVKKICGAIEMISGSSLEIKNK